MPVAGVGTAQLLSMAIPAGIGAAGDALTAASMPEGNIRQSFGAGAAAGAVRDAQGAAQDQLARTQAYADQGVTVPQLDFSGFANATDPNIPGLTPGLLGIRPEFLQLANSPLGNASTPSPAGSPPVAITAQAGSGGGAEQGRDEHQSLAQGDALITDIERDRALEDISNLLQVLQGKENDKKKTVPYTPPFVT